MGRALGVGIAVCAANQSCIQPAINSIANAITSVVDTAHSIAQQVADACKSDNSCPPCKTVSGRIVPAGTIGYRPLDVIPDDEVQHGVAGSHHNIFVAHQNPNNCQCFWGKKKYVLKPNQLPAGAVPVEAFVN